MLSRIQGVDGDETYQGANLAKYEEGLTFLDRHKNEYAESVMSCLKDRVKMQHTSLLTDTLTLLATHGWEKFESSDFVDISLGNLTTRFHIPLEMAGVDVMLLKEEFDNMLDYAKRYLPLSRDGYRTTWWKRKR